MVTFLLSLIPGPWLAILKALPWRLIGYALAAVAVVWGVLTVNGWRLDSDRLQATETALAASKAEVARYVAREAVAQQALREAEGKAKEREAEDRATAERIENELQAQLAASTARGRDLARRLLDAGRAACPGSRAVPGAAGAAAEPAGAGRESGDAGGIGPALAAHLTACEADATRLAGWQTWWLAVSPARQPESDLR